ncbi:MAG: type II/IV secretion system protein [Desulfobulbaceae bacterium]|nr:type II/IV secretion system protein [Desulfobulbaceae bacterium]
MLIEEALLSDDQLNDAIKKHKKTNLKLGQYLVREGIVSESQIIDTISRQLRIEKYRPDKYPIDVSLSKAIPAEIAQKHQAVPLQKNNLVITVAMLDPMDIYALDAIEVYSNTEAEPVICTEQEFNHLFGGIYGTSSWLADILEDIDIATERVETDIPENVATEDIATSSLQDIAQQAPIIRLVNSILSQAVRDGASDVHISPEKNYIQVRFRLDGNLHEVPAPPKSSFLPIVSRLKLLSEMDIAASRIPQDGRFTINMDGKEINIRTSTIPTIHGENIVLRLLDTSAGIFSLERLGMAEDDREKVESVIKKPYGLTLSTGPTGSGKSSSLYSILSKINTPDINIITLEDPVEYRVDKIRQVQLNRKAGMTFANGLRSILRQDPDVIMVGEIRDEETASIAVQAALTGHRVFSTVHTNDAAGAITRFIDMGIEPFLISSVMLLTFAQRLIRKICPNCKVPFRPPERDLKYWGLDKIENAEFSKGTGCFSCMNSGYKGRTGIFEVLVVNEMIQEMILKRKSTLEITRAAKESAGLRTLKDHAAIKVAKGITTLEEASSAVLS